MIGLEKKMSDTVDLSNIDTVTRAAILMMTLGPHEAATIMKFLGPKQVQRLGIAMATLKNVDQKLIEAVVDEFLDSASSHTNLGIDSDEYIKDVMVRALGKDKANTIIDRILIGANARGLETLKWMDPKSVADVIRFEHPQIQAIVLSYLDPDQAAAVLSLFDDETRVDITMRIASLDSVQPRALQELNDIMQMQFHDSSVGHTASVGGLKTAAHIMNFLDTVTENQLIDAVKEKDYDMGQSIHELMFVFENIVDLDDRDVQTLLREISSESLMLSLKGSGADVKEKVFKNMSKRAAELMQDDLEAKGPVKISEVETAQKEILATARRLAEVGDISLGGKGREEMV